MLVGPNGAGKTSLLEAIYFLATTRSFRTSALGDCRRHGEAGLSVTGRVEQTGRVDLAAGLNERGLYRKLNGKDSRLSEYLAGLPVVSWSAADSRLIDGSPAERRRFLDQGVVGVSPSAISVLTRYRKALDQKRELLRQGHSGLSPWNAVLAEAGSELMERRHRYVIELREVMADLVRTLGLETPEISIEYRSSPEIEPHSAENLAEALERLRGSERDARRPLIGPHRDELFLSWGGREARRVGSAGEKKLLGMVLTAARGRVLSRHGRDPVYLLDDIDSELDRDRLVACFSLFSTEEQVISTSSNPDLSKTLEGMRTWSLSDGGISLETGPKEGT